MEYRIHRSGQVDLVFDGEMLADESSRGDQMVDQSRWTEVRIYRLASGEGWVTETVGKSSRKGEVDRARVTVCAAAEEVKESLRRRAGEYIINAALDALEDAAAKDPQLLSATVEKL